MAPPLWSRTLELPQQFKDAMVEHALAEDPNECCGLIAGKDGKLMKHYAITNVEKSPYRYKLDDKEFLDAYRDIGDNDWDLEVIYHSHTHSPAYPSATDIKLVTWPDSVYLLLSLAEQDESGTLVRKEPPELRSYRIIDGEVTEEPIVVV